LRSIFLTISAAMVIWSAFCPPSMGHEVKVFASNLHLPPEGGKTTIYLGYGHRMPIDDLLDAKSIEKYEVILPDGTSRPIPAEGLGVHAAVMRLETPGLHRVVAVRRRTVFTYVFETDGNRALKRGGKSDHAGAKVDNATRYQDCGVAMIACGDAAKAPLPMGLPAEIVPLAPPAEWRSGRDIQFRLLVAGKPAEFAHVVAKPMGHKPDEGWAFATETNRAGIARLRADRPATWLIKATVKTPASVDDSKDFDWNSITTSLTLEIEP